jgi:ubiquitin-protein ligase
MTDIGVKTQKRLAGEIRDLMRNKMDFAQAIQDDQNPLIFYFMLRPKDKPYIGGLYIGKIVLPKDYPTNPGEFYTLTPNGRFEVNKKICLTNSNYHKESWVPLWSIRNMILGFISIFIADDTTGLSHIKEDTETRLFKAQNSHSYNMANYKDITLKFDQFIKPDGTPRTDNEVIEYIKPVENTKESSMIVPIQPLVTDETTQKVNSEPNVTHDNLAYLPTENITHYDHKEELLVNTVVEQKNVENIEKIPEINIEEQPIKIVKNVDVQKEIFETSLKDASIKELINRLSSMNLISYNPEIVLLIESKLKDIELVFKYSLIEMEPRKRIQTRSTQKYPLRKSLKITKPYNKSTDYINRLSEMTIDTYDKTLVDLILKNK